MKKRIGVVVLVLLLLLLAGAGAGFYYYYSKYINIDAIYPGVTIQGMSVGGMTQEEAEAKVQEYVDQVSQETVTLQVRKKETAFPLSDIGLKCTNMDVVEEAYNLGKTGNVFKRVMEVRELEKKGTDFPLTFSVDKEETKKVVAKKAKKFLAKKKDATIKRVDGKFVITKHVHGIAIDFDANAEKLAEVFGNKDWNHKSVVFPMDYTLDKAKHTKKELSAIKDVLGTYTTSYAGSASGRCANVENGASLINGTVLYPGESFSVYSKVAPFTAANGYHLAGSYSNGQTVQTYGGGICQVSTTLYNAVLRAELNVTERLNHSMTVHYVPLSADAAISGTDKDLKFTNNLDHPIYIQGTAGGSSITFTIYGKEYRASNRKVEYVSETVSTRGPSEKVIKDNTMEEGKRVVESNGRTGYTARLWKVVYIDGKETKRTQVNSSSYMSTPSVVRVGTKKKEVPKPTTETGKKTTKAEDKAKADVKQPNGN
jgi:vancomycin resistance protein YoaR